MISLLRKGKPLCSNGDNQVMINAREEILSKIKAGLDPLQSRARREKSVETRLSNPSKYVIPKRAQLDRAKRILLFQQMAEEVAATTSRVSSLNELPETIIEYLNRHNLPSHIKTDTNPLLNRVDWAKHPTLEVKYGKAEDCDQNSVTVAFAGVAETGTAVLTSGPNNPTTLNFLPENHIIILPVSRLFGTYEETWARLRAEMGEIEKTFPRTVNWITGPSRTGDIEQTIQLGIHGPKRLHVILVEGNDEETG